MHGGNGEGKLIFMDNKRIKLVKYGVPDTFDFWMKKCVKGFHCPISRRFFMMLTIEELMFESTNSDSLLSVVDHVDRA